MLSMKNPNATSHCAPSSVLRLAGGLCLLSVAGFSIPAASASPLLADVSINIGIEGPPPPLRHEMIVGVSPGPDFIWVDGYWDGAPGHYTWVAGRWGRQPNSRSRWNAPHWDKDRDGHYHQTKGEWRNDDHHDGHGDRDHEPRH
jgi:hypothetical protein